MNIPLENLEILQKNVNELKKENQELKDTNMKYAKLIDDFQTKNMLLEKAIEILKDKLGLYFNEYINYSTINAILPIANNDCNRLTQQEYELLKEVLENE